MMKTTKFGTLFLISIMALAGITAGYAIWQETLTISGTVGTGTFDIEIIAGETGSDETIPTSTITATDDDTTLTITITNAYPSITYYVNFSIKNVGTIPASFEDWSYDVNTVPGGGTSVTITPYSPSTSITTTTLEEDESWNGKLEVHLPYDGTGQTTSYSFTITVNGYQYNGTPT